ncbi:MAG: hypothetical protein LBJ64_01840 [Deltaproteobacteria bacterium]|nr:hypothetical protein [Deltaproteobacteria bacterium]
MEKVIQLVEEDGYSRQPIVEDNLEHVVGFLMVKDLLKHWPPQTRACRPNSSAR